MNNTEQLEAVRKLNRRKRVNRIKTGIIVFITGWIFVSLIAIVVLSVWVTRLNSRLNQLEKTICMSYINQSQPSDNDSSLDELLDEEGERFFLNSEDNIALEGDAREVYLTFDSIPSGNTEEILAILEENNVKATFFISGEITESKKQICKEIEEAGHTIGMNSYSHQYSKVYASTDAFEEDLSNIQSALTDALGHEVSYYRFPGGSANGISSVPISDLIAILDGQNITYYDWNVSAADLMQNVKPEDITRNVVEGASHYKCSVVLLHDQENLNTVEALPDIIKQLKDNNVEFKAINNTTYKIQFVQSLNE